MNEKLVCIIIVNYFGNADTIECIHSINKKATFRNYEIIVVDNSEEQQMYESLVTQHFAQTEIIKSGVNNGFAAACNIGIERAKEHMASYVLLLNNDTVIKSNDFIEQLLMGFQTSDVGMVGGKIYYYDRPDSVWYAAGYISPVRLRAKNRTNRNGIFETPFITGCLQMISMEAIEKTGLLREDYFLTYEDCDYCERLHRNGLKTVYNSNAQVYHKVSRSNEPSSPSSIYYSNRARYIFIQRFYGKSWFVKMYYFFELYLKKMLYQDEKKQAIVKVLKEIKRM